VDLTHELSRKRNRSELIIGLHFLTDALASASSYNIPSEIPWHGRNGTLRLISKERSKKEKRIGQPELLDVHCFLARAFHYVTDKRVLVKLKGKKSTFFPRNG